MHPKSFAQSLTCKRDSVPFEGCSKLIMWIIYSAPFMDEETEALDILEFFNSWKNKSSSTAIRL